MQKALYLDRNMKLSNFSCLNYNYTLAVLVIIKNHDLSFGRDKKFKTNLRSEILLKSSRIH